MIGSELIVKFKADEAYLTSDKPMSFSQIGLLDKPFKSPAYWKFRVSKHIVSEQKLVCDILSYHVGEIEFPLTQLKLTEELNKVKSIKFSTIDTFNLLKTRSGTPGSFMQPGYDSNYRRQTYFAPREPFIRTRTETFSVPIKNIHFKLGHVSFSKKFKEYQEPIEFIISNPEIIEEYDAIKNYFGNVLGSKKVEVTVEIEITDYSITSVKASSPEIAKIDKQLIEQVRLEFVRSVAKKLPAEGDKSLFTRKEYFDTFADENFKVDTFHKSDEELLEDLLTISKTKHYKHLRFLSSKHAHDIMKLRFIPKPFSFIFLLVGKMNYHIVWETLDTEEATYVWHIEKDKSVLKETLRKIDHTINGMKAQGKRAYITSTEDSLKRIYHDYSEKVDGFGKWKSELEHVLK